MSHQKGCRLPFWEDTGQHFHDDLNDAVGSQRRQSNNFRCSSQSDGDHCGGCRIHGLGAVMVSVYRRCSKARNRAS